MSNTAIASPTTPMKIGNQELTLPAQGKCFMLTRHASGFVVEEVASLTDGRTFVKRDASGIVRLVYKPVKLYADKKEIARISKDKEGNETWIITVPGYNKLNQLAGLQVLTPPSMIVAGVEHSNPFVKYHDVTGEIERVVCRKIAIGYSPNGNLVAVDTVRHYNFDAYYLADLQAKAKWKPNSARFGTIFMCPFAKADKVTKEEGEYIVRTGEKIYLFKRIKGVEGIWIDMSDSEINDVYAQHIQHQRFGDTIAQNIATRNALKAHPAISTAQVKVTNGVAEVMVFGYRHDMNQDQLREMGEQIVKGERVEGLEIKTDEGDDDAETVNAELEDALDETAAPSGDGGLFDKQGGMNVAPEELIENIKNVAAAKKADIAKLCKNLFNKAGLADLDPAQLARLNTVVMGIAVDEKGGK